MAASGDIAEEDAADLSLGKVFEDVTCLSHAEVAFLLRREETEKKGSGKELSRTFEKTFEYVTRFSGARDNQAALDQLREDLLSKEVERYDEERDETRVERLKEFEVAALSNIEPGSAEEAFALIPSLAARFKEDEMQDILEIIETSARQM